MNVWIVDYTFDIKGNWSRVVFSTYEAAEFDAKLLLKDGAYVRVTGNYVSGSGKQQDDE